ncbi:MAG: aminotransferase class IV [Planctomycetota bacterium]
MSAQWFAWSSGSWLPQSDVGLSLFDLGVLQAVSVVERLRTANARLIDLAAHLQRFEAGCRELGIELPASWSVEELSDECLQRHLETTKEEELAIVWMATPGVAGTPTLIVHAQPLPWSRMDSLTNVGQELVVSDSQSVPAECWSPQIKTRSRLHYYLADRQAREQTGNELAAGLLPNADGSLTETSAANIIVLHDGKLLSPPPESILQGVSLARSVRLAESLGLRVSYEHISLDMALQADELLLTGTTSCLWFASRLECRGRSKSYASGEKDSLFHRLSKAWCEDLELDYVEQAARNSAIGGAGS